MNKSDIDGIFKDLQNLHESMNKYKTIMNEEVIHPDKSTATKESFHGIISRLLNSAYNYLNNEC